MIDDPKAADAGTVDKSLALMFLLENQNKEIKWKEGRWRKGRSEREGVCEERKQSFGIITTREYFQVFYWIIFLTFAIDTSSPMTN